jgi:pimeloyl-ACP methyl ester carboxylesterase
MKPKISPYSLVLYILLTLVVLHPIFVNAQDRNPNSPDGPDQVQTLSSLVISDLETGGQTIEGLAQTLVGSGISVSNITFTGSNLSGGNFSGGLEIVGFDSGILLSSGKVIDVVGPNKSESWSTDLLVPGDPDLTDIANYPTYDATVLEFDFVPDQNQVSFQFVFASDEYNEFVNTEYNDVFGFYINGQNCALIDGDPISINTINNGNPFGSLPNSHPDFYLNNSVADGGANYDTEMDGLTFILTCSSNVVVNQTNHMKLAIADASDHVYDSAVFIRAGSITTERRPVILIPGMGASVNWDCFLDEQYCNVDSFWWWMPTASNYYLPMIDRLDQAGYWPTNFYFSLFLYDWRKPIGENVSRLDELIDMIQEETDQPKVDLIGHSMGGLLARAYVQSETYDEENDVAHIVTLGSPHQGALKAYPFWEGANLYEMEGFQKYAAAVLLAYYMKEEYNPVPVLVLRKKIPSFKDILPVFDYYLKDDETGAEILEADMKHRNEFLPSLNEDVEELFDRTDVATFVGQGKQTTYAFFVKPWSIFNLFNWVDGKPNFDRPDVDYKINEGDGTVLARSGILESANFIREFPGVDHISLPGNNDVINAVFAYLGITVAPPPEEPLLQKILIFFIDGNARAVFTDPIGRIIGPPEMIQDMIDRNLIDASDDLIPEAEYINVSDNPFQIIMIPGPIDGDYRIEVQGSGNGEYALGLIDTFEEDQQVSDPDAPLWDESTSQINENSMNIYKFNFSEQTVPEANLIAETPVIETPLYFGDTDVSGRAQPGKTIEIKDASSIAILGSGLTDSQGQFTVSLQYKLKLYQGIYPFSDGISGNVVVAVPEGEIFFPVIKK